jgi:hypothetical protein
MSDPGDHDPESCDAACCAAARAAAAVKCALSAHALHPSMNTCRCGKWRAVAGAGSLADQHREHVAERVTTALDLPALLAAERAEAIRDWEPIHQGILAQAVREARAAALREAAQAIVGAAPPYGAELRYDGTEDPHMAAYLQGFREAAQVLDLLLPEPAPSPRPDRDGGGRDTRLSDPGPA